MGENSEISWTDHTFNPWIGCTAVSPACDHCYAERQTNRFGDFSVRRRTADENWRKPVRWNRAHDKFFAENGRRQRVFCASFADVFDNQVDHHWRADLWALIGNTPNLDWLLLTKRPQNIAKMLPAAYVEQLLGRDAPWGEGWPNVWFGVTTENNVTARTRIEWLVDIPVKIRFLSCEPLLAELDVSPWLSRLDWVICGGEGGYGARPMHPEWARGLRDQCAAADVPFHFKQWGDLLPESQYRLDMGIPPNRFSLFAGSKEPFMKLGKKRSGRLLDGITHDSFPSA